MTLLFTVKYLISIGIRNQHGGVFAFTAGGQNRTMFPRQTNLNAISSLPDHARTGNRFSLSGMLKNECFTKCKLLCFTVCKHCKLCFDICQHMYAKHRPVFFLVFFSLPLTSSGNSARKCNPSAAPIRRDAKAAAAGTKKTPAGHGGSNYFISAFFATAAHAAVMFSGLGP